MKNNNKKKKKKQVVRGESDSIIEVNAVCRSGESSYLAFSETDMVFNFNFMRNDPPEGIIKKKQTPKQEGKVTYDLGTSKRIFKFNEGVTVVEGLQFTEKCDEMVLEIRCKSEPSWDPERNCHGKVMTTESFSVGLPAGEVVAPLKPNPKPVKCGLELRRKQGELEDIKAELNSFMGSQNKQQMEKVFRDTLKSLQLLKGVSRSWICSLPPDVIEPTVDHLSGMSMDGGFCGSDVSITVVASMVRSDVQNLAVAELIARTEFEVDFQASDLMSSEDFANAVTGAVVEDLNSGNSILRSDPSFADADASTVAVQVATTAPTSVPVSTPETQAPTATPPTTTSPVTPTPITPSPRIIPVTPASGGQLVVSVMVTVGSLLVFLL